MREIKFRAWNKTRNEMSYDIEAIRYTEKGKIHQIDTAQDNILWPDQESELMQFTGLKDKNGKEIYCSDIVKGRFNVEKVADWLWLTLTDEEKKNGERLFVIPNDIVEFARMQLPDDLEVIGNIYENPEMLETDQGA